jgi:predicted N-acetyltransferase YhbS
MITTRAMVEADAEQVAKLSGELGYPSDAEAIRRRLRAISPADLLLVAVEENGAPTGFIHAMAMRTIEEEVRVHVMALVVSSRVRRNGTGRKLISEAENCAREIGAEGIVVRSNVTRGEAHEFYPALGFRKIKTQAVYLKQLER